MIQVHSKFHIIFVKAIQLAFNCDDILYAGSGSCLPAA